MGKTYDAITDSLREFIQAQQMFFVATAPLGQGLVNLSPKGLDSLRILDPHTVAYADLTGSGIETVAHLKDNPRIVLMFCAFAGPAKIVRLHGQGDVVEMHSPEFAALAGQFPEYLGVRAIIRVRCTRISDSCGFGVPLYDFKGQRTLLLDASKGKGELGLQAYRTEKNVKSVDGLPGIAPPEA